MDKKEIQEQRMRSYFIEAAKEIIRGEGFKAISVRNIAERAGYSYTTLYNYFKDMKDLIFVCVKDFQDECTQFISEQVKKDQTGTDAIKSKMIAFSNYFIQYPGIFELFYVEKIPDLNSQQSTTQLIYNFLDRLCEEDWNYCLEKKLFTKEETEDAKVQLQFFITGLLLFYLNRRQPSDYKEFITLRDKQITNLLKQHN
ncbi:MAG: TetR/AcrR family transcriptional regulator [Bacteroidetes bacterium]|nr:TetR/AcrR family transcriptional regulator [Bacteroidota bacterium]